ncbi:hypothetical protein [Kamptonema sp. UHCC 0994]|uniref:hypothetical protein n=1 Tax=Kamptonema sp. UHCC 0994 TaxID=3031329 RepID=UPI0023B936F9|nr:hypothetical protein [Kamptonema sp. UHCC 0994]MDF0552688.1 hypothetical protein [Kamptonema sp. UHCC 0994]
MNRENTDSRKNTLREIFEKELVEFLDTSNDLREFMPEQRIVCVDLEWNHNETDILPPEIVRPPQNLPKNILNTFERHLWYSRHNISDIYLLKFPVDGQDAFFFIISGHCHDSWDNSCLLVEILDEQGESLGSGDILYRWEEGHIKWMDRQLDGRDYYKTAPPWDGYLPPEDYSYRNWVIPIFWSEE